MSHEPGMTRLTLGVKRHAKPIARRIARCGFSCLKTHHLGKGGAALPIASLGDPERHGPLLVSKLGQLGEIAPAGQEV